MANRRREWIDTILSESVTSTSVDAKELVPVTYPDETKGLTVVRFVIGIDLVALSPVTSDNDQMKVNLGIGMLSDAAILESAAFPSPAVEGDDPVSGWLWRTSNLVEENSLVLGSTRIDADLRAQRKFMYGSPVLLIANTAF